jgi:5'-nucleotidase
VIFIRILISNDDGIQSPGIEALVKVLHKEHKVIVAAPATQQSAMAHALTVRKRLYVEHYAPLEEKYGVEALMVSGTPTDCVKLYMEGIAKEKIDLVISGINNGSNLGTDILYSGTLGAALEGHIHGVHAIALSLDYKAELTFDFVAETFVKKMGKLMNLSDKPQLLNVNFPKKLKADYNWYWAKQGVRDYENAFIPNTDDDGRLYYWVGGEIIDSGNSADTDIELANAGNITVTPILMNWCDFKILDNNSGKTINLE